MRAPAVLDSLGKARYDSTALALARLLLNPPTAGGAGFGRGGGGSGAGNTACERPFTQWEPFCARPAEATQLRIGAPATGAGGMADLQERAAQLRTAGSNPAVRRIFDLVGMPVPATAGRGGFGFGGGVAVATTGDYAVVLQVGGTVMKQKLRVENMGAAGASNPFGFEEEDDHDR